MPTNHKCILPFVGLLVDSLPLSLFKLSLSPLLLDSSFLLDRFLVLDVLSWAVWSLSPRPFRGLLLALGLELSFLLESSLPLLRLCEDSTSLLTDSEEWSLERAVTFSSGFLDLLELVCPLELITFHADH